MDVDNPAYAVDLGGYLGKILGGSRYVTGAAELTRFRRHFKLLLANFRAKFTDRNLARCRQTFDLEIKKITGFPSLREKSQS